MSSSDALQKIQRELINNFESTPMKIFSYVVILGGWSLVMCSNKCMTEHITLLELSFLWGVRRIGAYIKFFREPISAGSWFPTSQLWQQREEEATRTWPTYALVTSPVFLAQITGPWVAGFFMLKKAGACVPFYLHSQLTSCQCIIRY